VGERGRGHVTAADTGPGLDYTLRPPGPPKYWVGRSALAARVCSTPPGGLCLVEAPAGWGGTVLLAEVARTIDVPVAWVSCLAHEPGPTTFWRQALAALNGLGVPTEQARSALDGAAEDRSGFLTALLDTLARQPDLMIVVDDLDGLVHTSILEDLQRVVHSHPLTVRLVLRVQHGSRLDLRRPAAGGLLVRLGVEELALDDDQARRLVRTAAPSLGDERVAALLTLADGWPAAIALPFTAPDRDPALDPAGWLLDTGVDQLAGAVWHALPADDQAFLAMVSILDVLSPDGCAALVERDAQEVADRLERLLRWGLLRRSGDGSPALVPHRLLGEYGRRVLSSRGRAETERLHRLASQSAQASGDAQAAVTHALDAGDVAGALQMLEGSVGELFDTGQAATVRALYSRSPAPLVTATHLHLLGAAWSELLAGKAVDAQRWLDQLLAAVAALPATVSEPLDPPRGQDGTAGVESGATWLRAEALLLQAQVAGWQGRPARSRDFADRALRLFGDRWTRMAHQAAAIHAVRARLWLDDRAAARTLLVRVSARPGLREYLRRVSAAAQHAHLAAQEGRAHRARHLAESVMTATAELGPLGRFDDADALLARSRALVDLDDPAAAATDAASLVERAAALGHVTYEVLGMLALARAHAGQGSIASAVSACEDARTVLRAEAPGSELMAVTNAAELSVRLFAGDRQGAAVLLRRSPPGPIRDQATARLMWPRSGEMARRAQIAPETDPRQAVETRLVSALAAVTSRPGEAETWLRAAGDVAVQAGMLTALRGYPEHVMVLADRVAARPDGAAVAVLAGHARPVEPSADPPGHDPVRLSDGEVTLLSLMAAHRGHADLAAALGVSVNTVKTRLRRLYRKLGVSDRASALQEARARGLGSSPPDVTR
jgi:LuxR family transcriptional regulator, maltose regulon positive regulatory protein